MRGKPSLSAGQSLHFPQVKPSLLRDKAFISPGVRIDSPSTKALFPFSVSICSLRSKHFEVTKETQWEELLHSSDKHLLRLVKQFIYISVRIVFDPPAGSVLTTLTTSLNNLSHRIIIQKEVYNAKPE